MLYQTGDIYASDNGKFYQVKIQMFIYYFCIGLCKLSDESGSVDLVISGLKDPDPLYFIIGLG